MVYKKKKKKKEKIKLPRGRPRYNVSFEEAKKIVRDEMIYSVGEYKKWWAYHRPAKMPKRPDRAYKKEFTTWAEFLGRINDYPFVGKRFLPYAEAEKFVHSLNIKNVEGWIEYVKSGKKPNNIPARPDVVYQTSKTHGRKGEWISWSKWLKMKLPDKIEIVKKKYVFLLVYRDLAFNENVYRFERYVGTEAEMIEYVKKLMLTKIRMYAVYLCGDYPYMDYLKFKYQPFISLTDAFLIPNINDVIFNFDINMLNRNNLF